MPVNSHHPEYTEAQTRVRTTRDATAGEEAVKNPAVRKLYLPGFDPEDNGRYELLIKRAYYVNYCQRMLSNFCGAAFRNPPKIELPAAIEYMRENADGAGSSIEQMMSKAFNDVAQTGNYGILAEYSKVPEGASEDDRGPLGIRASLAAYSYESIINWNEEKVGGNTVRTLTVLHETARIPVDEYTFTLENQYRVLRLVDGVYETGLYLEDGTIVEEAIRPTQQKAPMNTIPFFNIGSVDNKPTVDMPLLFPAAVINLAHYRNTADYEEGLHMTGQGTPHIDAGPNTTAAQFEAMNPNGVRIGARDGIITQGGSFEIVQQDSPAAGLAGLAEKVEQLKDAVSAIAMTTSSNKTAETAKIEASGETSQLSTIVTNIEDAFTAALKEVAKYEGANPDEVVVTLNRDFFDKTITPQESAQMLAYRDAKILSLVDLRARARKAGFIEYDKTDEQIDEEIANEPDDLL